MNKKEELKIAVLSNIKEEIIDKQSEKRYKLMTKKRAPRWIMPSSVAAVILVAIMVPILILLFAKQVPVYEGMTVSKYKPVSSAENVAPEREPHRFSYLSNTNGNNGNGDNGNHYGQNKKPVDEIIEEDTSIGIEVPEQPMYYANAGQEIYITVHISNPDSFEILSFTLNGKKYSSYMFEEGSDMENLILKVTVPANAEGVIDYTIDAIKYVDGTDIKDVDMRGERTVKVGVSTSKQPEATVSDELIRINDVSFNVTLSDGLGLIERCGGKAFAVVVDGDSILSYEEITVGDEHITFEGLETYTSYRYGVVAYYDALDGNGMDIKILFEKEFTTQSVVAPDNIVKTQTSIEFGLIFNELYEEKNVTSMSLYHGEDKVKDFDLSGDALTKTFSATELLSNNEYTVVISYTNAGATETVEFHMTTEQKVEPTFTLKDVTSDTYTISGSYDQTNADNTLISYTVKLFKGDELVKESTDKQISFDSLDYYTDYTVKITYTFDVNDGIGVQTKTVEQNISTLPLIDVKTFLVRNPMLFEEDSCYIQIDIDNPLKLTVTHVTINGEEYAVLPSSTTDSLFVEMSCKGVGGNILLSAEKFKATFDDETYAIAPITICEDTVFVNGVFEVIDIEITNKEGEAIYWLFPDENYYIRIRANNPTEYDVTAISISGHTVNVTEADKITSNEYIINCERYLPSFNSEISISYKNQYASKTIVSSISNYQITPLTSDEIRYISTVDDLKNANDSCYYELTNDIDLLGVNWIPKGFTGVLNGNGYAIKNMMYVGEISRRIGLFDEVYGAVCNLTIDNAFIMSSSGKDEGVYTHALIAAENRGTILNCTINSSSTINCENEKFGGFVGDNYGVIRGCVNNANIASYSAAGIACENTGGSIIGCTNNGGITGGTYAFGIAKRGMTGENKILGCTNNGNIYSNFMACGIIDYSENVYNCVNNGNVTGDWAYGIAHEAWVYNCLNTGTIASINTSGSAHGIGGPNLSGEAVNCLNIGSFKEKGTNIAVSYGDECYNCYTIELDESVDIGKAQICSIEQLNSKEFYTQTLGWSEDIWDFSELDFENGKYPKLRND